MALLRSDTDTIAAVSTPRGEGGIGVIRISGPNALPIAERLFHPSRRRRYRPQRSHMLTHGVIRSPETGHVVDEALVAYFRAPNTYTGEEMIEIHGHGGTLVLNRILELVCDAGARPANPGEFTQRAFLNGRLDLAQAEAVADVIAAKTEWSLRAATAQLRGSLSREVEELRRTLIALLAEVEAQVDFPDEDLDFEATEALMQQVHSVDDAIRRLLADAEQGRILRDGLNVVIVGKPNVGKSSLLNALLREERAIVTPIPGTTRDVIEDYLNLRGIPVRLSDTAGIRATVDPVEVEGVARSHRQAASADLLLIVLDTSRPLDGDDATILESSSGRPRLLVLNKSDLTPVWSADALNAYGVDGRSVAAISLTTGDGVEAFLDMLVKRALGNRGLGAEPPLVTNVRHRQALLDASCALSHVVDSLRMGASPELVAVDLRGALNAVGLIVGETATDDLLDRIFSRFCVGK
jgi:tRNA modification GTPase